MLYKIASKEEAIKLYLSNDDYFNSLLEYDIQYRTQNIDGRVELLKKYGISQIQEYCYMLNILTKSFEKQGDSYIKYYKTILVSINSDINDKDYYIEESDNYWDIFGENTKYIVNPEECMADNFGYVLIYGLNGTMNYIH